MKRRLCAAETARLPGHPRPFLRPRGDPRARPRSPRDSGPAARPQVSAQTGRGRRGVPRAAGRQPDPPRPEQGPKSEG